MNSGLKRLFTSLFLLGSFVSFSSTYINKVSKADHGKNLLSECVSVSTTVDQQFLFMLSDQALLEEASTKEIKPDYKSTCSATSGDCHINSFYKENKSIKQSVFQVGRLSRSIILWDCCYRL